MVFSVSIPPVPVYGLLSEDLYDSYFYPCLLEKLNDAVFEPSALTQDLAAVIDLDGIYKEITNFEQGLQLLVNLKAVHLKLVSVSKVRLCDLLHCVVDQHGIIYESLLCQLLLLLVEIVLGSLLMSSMYW